MPVDVLNLLSPEGAIARRLPGFESRPQQVEMAAAVDSAMEKKGRLLIEAGTGVGKSFAYLIPAIKRIVEHNERVLVVTNTINLQEQLIEKDIPLLNAVIPEEFSAVLVKGRGNYISLRRLKLASEKQERLFYDDDARHSLHIIEDWAYGTRDGTLATLPQLSRSEVWDYVQSDSHNCMGKKCPTYDKCFYQQARRRMENGQLLVCNHALFFSDLALRVDGVGFLPKYQHVILDEAHCVEEVAADHFGMSVSEGRVRHLLNLLYQSRTRRGFLTTLKLKDGSTQLIDQTIEHTLHCRDEMERFFSNLLAWQSQSGVNNGRIRQPDIIENTLVPAMKDLSANLRILKENAASEQDEYELNSYSQRTFEIVAAAESLVSQTMDGCVYWLEGGENERNPRPTSGRGQSGGHSGVQSSGHSGGHSSGGSGERGRLARAGSHSTRRTSTPRVALKCSAVDVAPILQDRLFNRDISVIMTSATLAIGPNNFSHIKTRLGCENATAIQLGSPFDHAAQMRVLIDRSMPEPNQPNYVDRLVPRIADLIRKTDGGAFVLFTSFAMLNSVANRLRPLLQPNATSRDREGADDAEPLPYGRGSFDGNSFPLLIQGADGPPGLLLKRFRDDERSVLLGTNSFWQGVDVRGRGLRNVIITRLPFEVPDRPIVEARHELITKRGGNAFFDDQLPRAVIRFKQGVGRLIRSTTDTGLVAILDPRIVTKAYGKLFLESLPEGVEIEDISNADSSSDADASFD